MSLFQRGKPHIHQIARTAVAAVLMMVLAPSAFAACEDIARIPLVPSEIRPTEGSLPEQICTWQTLEPWAPPEICGNQGFEVVGWGDRPPVVNFKRTNTIYSKTWETRQVEPEDEDSPVWTSASLDRVDTGNRCFAGWCRPVNYILRTAAPVSVDVCGQTVELRVLLTDKTE